MHLPAAPKCNISCSYCNRKYDCRNESRPGVSSGILTPQEALTRFLLVREKMPNLSVVGIAGPGDALADWKNTRTTLGLIRQVDKKISFCLSTNGLLVTEHLDEIIQLGVEHVTVTVNCINPDIGEKIYQFVNYHGTQYRGWDGAALLLEKQLEGIAQLSLAGVLVKVNTVMITGVNDDHIPEIAGKMKELGAFISNIVPLIPIKGSCFEHYPQTSTSELVAMRQRCAVDLQQMRHCRQCRADAVGMLNEDRRLEIIQAG